MVILHSTYQQKVTEHRTEHATGPRTGHGTDQTECEHVTGPIYIFLLFLSELVYYIPEDSILAKAILIVAFKTKSSPFLAIWAFLEGFFYIFFKLHLVYLQVRCQCELQLAF